MNSINKITDYIDYLTNKGFTLGEEAVGFINFGKQYTSTEDKLVIIAIELTLKIQKEFDGAFFISLLEMFHNERVRNKKQALILLHSLNLI
ncbi:DUF6123 family protein [Metabacillus malikii]|uniref:Uncharacterized protein n=1 Tax=Metabacillus malikii TaxID=1504265 RepID=A0ABT9ZA58_9BACI|nr:DUF6123 family protein [Metabacillus malikii]MDQ0228829.1 hypothetical protein [Metabacillus malikii]